MSTDCQPPAGSSPAANDVSAPFNKRRIDRIDELPRPLGAKRAALLLRRESKANGHGVKQPMGDGALTLASKDATIRFTLRATAFGLLIERSQRHAIGARLVQSMVFADQRTFDRWCDAEPMRFEDPMLYDRLRREGHEAFGGER